MHAAHTRRSFLAMVAGALAASAGTSRPAKRPNIVFILLDDLGWRDFGCYGNTFHETPNIDRLAREGVRFTNSYAACPVCSPTRASILTGKNPARLHLTDWIPGRAQWPAARLLVPKFEQQLNLRETTIAEALKPLGYRTASIGKWHLGGKGFLPEQQGFDVSIGGDSRGSVRSFFGPFDLPGLSDSSKNDYITERLTQAAEGFLEESVRAQQPFFLYLPEYAVHRPLQAREAAIAKYRAKLAGKDFPNPIYAAMVESADVAVGHVRKKLEQLGVADHTILIVTSDNGGLRYEGKQTELTTDNSPLRAGKGHLYEGGIREPLIVYWPGVTKAGRVVDTPVISDDFFPTIVQVAGGKPSSGLDGQSLAPLMRGGRAPARDTLYWHYPHYSNQGGVPSGAIRKGDWKLIEFYEDGRLELYNLREDIGERRNLAEKEPGKAAELRAALRKWREHVNAVMPQSNPAYDALKANQGLTGAEPATPPIR